MRLGQTWCKAPLFVFLAHRCFLVIKHNPHRHRFSKLEVNTLCKLERWVLYKMVALTSGVTHRGTQIVCTVNILYMT